MNFFLTCAILQLFPQKNLNFPFELTINLQNFNFSKCNFSLHLLPIFKNLPTSGTLNEIFYYFEILKFKNIGIIDTENQNSKIIEFLILQKCLVGIDVFWSKRKSSELKYEKAYHDANPILFDFSAAEKFFISNLKEFTKLNNDVEKSNSNTTPLSTTSINNSKLFVKFGHFYRDFLFLITDNIKYFKNSSFHFKNFKGYSQEMRRFLRIIKMFRDNFKFLRVFSESKCVELRRLNSYRVRLGNEFFELEMGY